jgi:tetratricopeptide (TPR) repeat protein
VKSEKSKPPGHKPAPAIAPRPAWREKLDSPTWLSALLFLATALLYLPIGRNDFVNYDDPDYVTSNAQVQSGFSRTSLIWAFTTGAASNWHPLTWLSHMLDWQLFGDKAGGHHLVSIAFHAVNAALLFLVWRRLTGAHWQSALVAALFAWHPLHVESVAWASERKDVLSAFFFLLTLGAYARYAHSRSLPVPSVSGGSKNEMVGAKSKARRAETTITEPARTNAAWSYYFLALGLYALGLLSKPMLVTTPFVLLLLDYWPLARIALAESPQSGPDGGNRPTLGSGWAGLVLEKMPFFALSIASSIVTFNVQKHGGAVSTSITVGARLANAVVSYVRYIVKMLWPVDLSVLYPHPGSWPVWAVILSCAILLLISAGVLIGARRRPYLVTGWLWFLGMMVPVIGLVQVGIQSMADRYTYLPMIGLFVIIVWGLSELPPLRAEYRKLAVPFTTMVLVLCVSITERQLGFWRNSETLFKRATQVTTRNYLAHNNLGFWFSNQGRMAEAMEEYEKSLKINPNYEDALNNMGYALANLKRYPEAIGYYLAALRVHPDHAEVHNNLGNALSETGQIEEAMKHYRATLKQVPTHANAHNNLGIALAMQGKLDEAIPHFEAAIRTNPKYASAHSNLGNALAAQHKIAEAVKEYQEAIRLQPGDSQSHNNLGNGYAEQGRLDEAITQYSEALRLNTNNPEAHYNLGLALGRQGKRQDAVEHFSAALRLKPDYADARTQLNALTGTKAQ